MRTVVLLVCVLFSVSGYCDIAKFIKPCHRGDKVCLISSAQSALPTIAAGIPKLGMNPLDPMHMAQVKTVQAGLVMDFRNTIVRGLRNCKVLKLKRFTNKTALDLKCSVTLIGDYNLGGRLLILPIEGAGKYKIKIRDIVVKVMLNIGERVSNGTRYWTIKGFKHTADVLGRVRFYFQNLFNGDKSLADPVMEYANSNWHAIFHDVAPPIVSQIVSQIVDETAKFFNRVPIKQLSLQ